MHRVVQKILDSSSSFEQEQVRFCEIMENYSSFCTRKGVKIELTKKKKIRVVWMAVFKLLHLWSSWGATGEKKKRELKKKCRGNFSEFYSVQNRKKKISI